MPPDNIFWNMRYVLEELGFFDYYEQEYEADDAADEAPAPYDGAIECEYEIVEDTEVLLLEGE